VTTRKAAARPAPRTIKVALNGTSGYPGWACTVRADFPARLVEDFESGDAGRVFGALEKIVLDHNFPDADGKIAEHMADVDPMWGLVAIAEAISEGLKSLPNR
jgi:hypothetical protein